ncbi:MAG: hypothetical protein IID40_06100 [Planctomycetes bacterium]|nr:hypothetical protein [Planctomycetota bacterium]
MIRLAHRLLIVVLSLLAVGTAVLGVVSYSRILYYRAATFESECFFVKVSEGDVAILRIEGATAIPREGRYVWLTDLVQEVPIILLTSSELRDQGVYRPFDWSRSRYVNFWVSTLRFPLLCPIVLALSYPILAFIRGPLRRSRRRRKGLCVPCGYNLTGNTSGVCPECGRKVHEGCGERFGRT